MTLWTWNGYGMDGEMISLSTPDLGIGGDDMGMDMEMYEKTGTQ